MDDGIKTALSRYILLLNELAAESHYAGDRPIYRMYLAQAAVTLAKVETGQPLDDEIENAEHLFGNTWLNDGEAYRRLHEEWGIFKGLLGQSMQGMTVNERLFTLGLLGSFDDATRRQDSEDLKSILRKCLLDEAVIQSIVEERLGPDK